MLDTDAGGWYHISGAGIRQAKKTERRGQTMAYKNSRQNAAETKTSSEKNEKKLKKLVYGLRIGAAAYLAAFILAALALTGKGFAWKLFGIQVTLMAIVTLWLIYLQGFVIGAFCQFCLLSAAVTFTLFIIFLISSFVKKPENVR